MPDMAYGNDDGGWGVEALLRAAAHSQMHELPYSTRTVCKLSQHAQQPSNWQHSAKHGSLA